MQEDDCEYVQKMLMSIQSRLVEELGVVRVMDAKTKTIEQLLPQSSPQFAEIVFPCSPNGFVVGPSGVSETSSFGSGLHDRALTDMAMDTDRTDGIDDQVD